MSPLACTLWGRKQDHERNAMTMTHRERIMASLDHREPDRVPVDFGGYPGATSINVEAYRTFKAYLGLGVEKELRVANPVMFTAEVDEEILDLFDIDTWCGTPTISLKDFAAPETFQDKWKVIWKRSDVHTYSMVDGPFWGEKGTLEALRRFQWPKPSEIEDLKRWSETVKGLREKTDRAILCRFPLGIVTLGQVLRGFEDWFMDLHLNPGFLEALLDRCMELWIETAELLLDIVGDTMDIAVWGDDYGLQKGPMISPEMFRKYVTPRNRKMVETIKRKSKAKVLLHSCGCVYPYLEDFVEMGLDALNPIQVSAKDMDPVRLKSKIGNRITLWGCIGIDDLVDRSTEQIKDLVKRRMGELRKDGGFVVAATHNILSDVPPQNLAAMLEAVRESE